MVVLLISSGARGACFFNFIAYREKNETKNIKRSQKSVPHMPHGGPKTTMGRA